MASSSTTRPTASQEGLSPPVFYGLYHNFGVKKRTCMSSSVFVLDNGNNTMQRVLNFECQFSIIDFGFACFLLTYVTCRCCHLYELLFTCLFTWVTCCLPVWLVVYLCDLLFTWLVWLVLRRNQNHLMRSLLASLMPYISEARVQNLVVAILAALPDQLAPFLNTLAPSLAPRPTSAWMNAVNLLTQVYSNFPL